MVPLFKIVQWFFLWQFYDHFFEWGLKEEILKLIMIRTRNRIKPNSAVRILASDLDLYVAVIDGKIIVKIGPGFDVGNLVPQSFKKIATSGKDYCCMGEKNNPDMKNPVSTLFTYDLGIHLLIKFGKLSFL